MHINDYKIRDYSAALHQKCGNPGTSERIVLEEEAYALYTGKIIEDARRKVKITQAELARRIGSNHSYISHVEKGMPSL